MLRISEKEAEVDKESSEGDQEVADDTSPEDSNEEGK